MFYFKLRFAIILKKARCGISTSHPQNDLVRCYNRGIHSHLRQPSLLNQSIQQYITPYVSYNNSTKIILF